jgi:type VI secretion system protein ImpM
VSAHGRSKTLTNRSAQREGCLVSEAASPPGWHGKLPTLGDFASRRLDPAFVEAWDGWLAAGLLALREAEPVTWLDAYLQSPSWRFVLQPGVIPGVQGGGGWAGVLMPSVDRVGRYFPFTIVLPLGERPASAQQMAGLWHWLGRLDELASDAMQDDWSVDRLEAELAGMAAPALDAPGAVDEAAPAAAGQMVEATLGPGVDAAAFVGAQAHAAWRARAAGLAHWFASTELVGQRMLISRGLPAPAEMHRLLGATMAVR